MNIVFDYQIFSYRTYGGISRYIIDLAAHCSDLKDMDVTILALMHKNRYLVENNIIGYKGAYVPHFSKTTRIRLSLNKQITGLALKFIRPDIVHHTYYDIPGSNADHKTVVTVHDMIHEKFPSEFNSADKTSILKKQAVQKADHIICISKTTREDLMNCYDIAPERISVVYSGAGLSVDADAVEKPAVKSNYILYVGRRGKYKNFLSLVSAYGTHERLRNNFRLLCFGGGPFQKSEKIYFETYNVADNVEYHSGGDKLLANLYSRAAVFVCPSLYEGFGLTVLEAMSAGCPVACSLAGSLPEIAAGAAEYFDPTDRDSIANALEVILFSDEHSNKLIRTGSQQAKRYSWGRCARDTARVYANLIA